MQSKKGADLMFSPLVWGILAIIVLVVMVVIWTTQFSEGTDSLRGYQLGSKDCDNDGIAGIFDNCPYKAGSEEHKGCPENLVGKDASAREACDQSSISSQCKCPDDK